MVERIVGKGENGGCHLKMPSGPRLLRNCVKLFVLGNKMILV